MKKITLITLLVSTLTLASDSPKPFMNKVYYKLISLNKSINEKDCKSLNIHINDIKKSSKNIHKYFYKKSSRLTAASSIHDFYLSELESACNHNKMPHYTRDIYINYTKSCTGCHQQQEGWNTEKLPLLLGSTNEEIISHLIITQHYDLAKKKIDVFFKNPNLKEYYKIIKLEQDLFLNGLKKPDELRDRYANRKNKYSHFNEYKIWKNQFNRVRGIKSLDELITKINNDFATDKKQNNNEIKYKIYKSYLLKYLYSAEKIYVPKILFYLADIVKLINPELNGFNNFHLLHCAQYRPKSSYTKKCMKKIRKEISESEKYKLNIFNKKELR